jgi:signal transduction histidine kinase/ligand-binding sensor domain-containing protein
MNPMPGNDPFGLSLFAERLAYLGPMLRRSLVIFFLLLGIGLTCSGQLRLPVRVFNADDGLGGATITSLIKDNRGFLWIGTPDELLLYDGRSFQPFRYAEAGHGAGSLPFRRAIVIAVDARRTLIFHDGGAHQFDHSSGRLIRIQPPSTTEAVSSGATMIADPDRPGSFRLNSSRLSARYYPLERRWEDVRRLPQKLRSVTMLQAGRTVMLDNDTADGGRVLMAVDPATGRQLRSWRLQIPLSAAAWLPEGALLVSSGNPARLWWKPDRGNAIQLNPLRTFSFSVHVIDAGAGDYYVASGQALLRFHAKTGRAEEILDDAGDAPVGKGVISHLMSDGRSAWLGTNASGLLRVSLDGGRFRHLRAPEAAQNFMHGIFPHSAAGRIYAGTYYGRVVVYDSAGNFLSEIVPPLRRGQTSAYISAIDTLSDGSLLILNGDNPFILHPRTRRTTSLYELFDSGLKAAGVDPLESGGRKGVTRINESEWWISEKPGFVRWKLVPSSTGAPVRVELRQLVRIPGSPEAIIMHDGAWYSAAAGMLYRLAGSRISDSFKLPLPSFVSCLREDLRGRLWIATESGIIVWKGGRVLRLLDVRSGLPNNHIYALQADNAGWIWASSNAGLFAVNGNDFSIRSFSGGDGLQGAEFNLGSTAKDATGRLYFGGMNGLNIVDPGTALREDSPAPVTMTLVAAPDTIYYSYPGPARPADLQLNYDHASLRIRFTAAHPAAAGPRQYEYCLDDADSTWIPAGPDGELQFQLAPGRYHIVIRQRGLPATAAAFSVRVTPPFFRTAWFLLLTIGLGGAVVASIVIASARSRYRRKVAALETAKQLQEEKERISRELHDELGARAALIAHNAALLQIAAPGNSGTIPYAARISDTTTDMLSALRETVWTLNQQTVSVESMWLRYKHFIVKLGASYEQIHFVVKEGGTLPGDPIHYSRALNLLRILQEAVMNAVKHSGATEIIVSAIAGQNHSTFTVADNGRGFDLEAALAAGEGNGLHNMMQRSREAGLKLVIRGGVPAGTFAEVIVTYAK